VNVGAFGLLPEVADRLIVPDVLAGPETRVYLAKLDGEPVASASTHVHMGAAGVFGVGTLPAARRRGIGTAITAFALRDRRAEADLAWLHPTDMGRAMYEAMGFLPVSSWAVYVRSEPWP
jgi:predicted GNAT family acetyltransferase